MQDNPLTPPGILQAERLRDGRHKIPVRVRVGLREAEERERFGTGPVVRDDLAACLAACLVACHGDNLHSKRGKVERQALGNLCGVARASQVEATA